MIQPRANAQGQRRSLGLVTLIFRGDIARALTIGSFIFKLLGAVFDATLKGGDTFSHFAHQARDFAAPE